MKRICLVDYDMTVTGGVEQVTANLSGMLTEYYETYVVSLSKKNSSIAYKLNSKVHYVQEIGTRKTRIRNVIMDNCFSFRSFLKREHIDCILAMGTYPGVVLSIICKGLKLKKIFCDHGALINQLNDKTVTKYRKIAYQNMDLTVTLTERSMLDYVHYMQADKNKVTYIYNSIDDEVFKFVKPYDKTSKVIMSAGRMTKEKGFDLLVDVAKEVFSEQTEWVWKIYGDGKEYQQIADKIKLYHLEDKLILCGETKEMYSKYSQCGLYVLTSYREGLPLVLLEAKANTIPIVSFDVETGPSEIVRDGKDGYLIEKYDCVAMAEKIKKLMLDTELREKFSQACIENIDQFRNEKIKKKWCDVIENI